MPTFDIVKESKADNSFRVESVRGIFDLQTNHIQERFTGQIDIEGLDWSVGIIYGASGTGKTTIARQLFGNNIFADFNYKNKSVIDDFADDKEVKEIIKTLNSVGFSSPPSYLKPYAVLSNGEKMRVDLANAVLQNKEIICFDEFTSVVNREVAKVGSFAIQKYIRKVGKKFIAVSCHYDIIDWLEPDWIFCTDNMKFKICKKKDQKSKFQFTNAGENFGNILANITI